MKNKIWHWQGIINSCIILAFVVSCAQKPEPEPITPEYNRVFTPSKITVPSFEWYIVEEKDMRIMYENSGMEVPEGAVLDGFAGWDGDKRVVVTGPPKTVDDNATLTLGHEVMHLTFGKYHKEVESER